MIDLAKSEKGENKLSALNNLIVLAREEAGSNEIMAIEGIKYLLEILKQEEKNEEVVLAIARIFASLCKNSFKRVF